MVQLLASDRETVLKQVGLRGDELQTVLKVLDKVPQVQMKWSLVAVDDRNEPLDGKLLEEGGEAQLVI